MQSSLPNLSQLDVSVKHDREPNLVLTSNNVKKVLREWGVIYSSNSNEIGVLSKTSNELHGRINWMQKPDAQGSYNKVFYEDMPNFLKGITGIYPYDLSTNVCIRVSKKPFTTEEDLDNACEEVYMTMLAADRGLAPKVYATYISKFPHSARLVMITEQGQSLDTYLKGLDGMNQLVLARQSVDLCTLAAQNHFLLLDIKPGNMIWSAHSGKVFMIDIDPTFSFVVEPLNIPCARFLMMLLLAANIRCADEGGQMGTVIQGIVKELLLAMDTECAGDAILGMRIKWQGEWKIQFEGEWQNIEDTWLTAKTDKKWFVMAISMLMHYLYNYPGNKTDLHTCSPESFVFASETFASIFSVQKELSIVGQLLVWLQSTPIQ